MAKAESETANAAAEGDLAVTAKAFAADTAALADWHKDRMKKGGVSSLMPDQLDEELVRSKRSPPRTRGVWINACVSHVCPQGLRHRVFMC